MTQAHPRNPVGRQRGAAILTAMLTVVLVATLAASALWQQWRGIEVEAAERSRTQSVWVLTGALDWARLILREDARQGGADHLAEPWAVPLEQARLSTFLAFDRSDALAADETADAFLSGRMLDLQSRLNVTNLVQNGKVHEPSRLAFERLFVHLGLPEPELATLAAQLALAQAKGADPATPPNTPPSGVPLWPQDLDQLAWVGLSARSLAVLRPYISLLPVATPVNLNTASAEVIYASVESFELADAHQLVTHRQAAHFATLTDARKAIGKPNSLNDTQHACKTDFFEVNGNLQVNQTTVQEKSLVKRDALAVKTLRRQRGVAVIMPTYNAR